MIYYKRSKRSKRSKKSNRSNRRKRSVQIKKHKSGHKFGYIRGQSNNLYGVHMDDGMLLANNAFQWQNSPLDRALNA